MKKKKATTDQSSNPLNTAFFLLRLTGRIAPLKLFLQMGISFLEAGYIFLSNIWFLKAILDVLERRGSFQEFLSRTLLMLGAAVVYRIAATWYQQYYADIVNLKIRTRLNEKLFEKAASVELACYENPEFYRSFRLAMEQANQNVVLAIDNLSAMAGAIVAVGLICGYIIQIDIRILLFIFLPLTLLGVIRLKNRLTYRQTKELTQWERQKDYVKQTIFRKDAAGEVRIGGVLPLLERMLDEAGTNSQEVIDRYGKKAGFCEFLIRTMSVSIPFLFGYGYAAYRLLIRKNLSLANFSVLITAILNYIRRLGRVFNAVEKMMLYHSLIENLRNFLEYEPAVKEGDRTPEPFRSLEFCGVGFRYREDGREVLNDVSLTVRKGERIAIVGHNGAGKSSFVKLLLRLYDPTAGSIKWNGRDIKEMRIARYRERFGTVFQDFRLFSLGVGENILLHPVAAEEEQTVWSALRRAGFDDPAKIFPDGLSTWIGKQFEERGKILSGGQQQKLAAARLFAGSFELAVLDEPSSALDPIAEFQMYQTLLEAVGDLTTIFISHRLSSAALADRIYLFENGTILESGSHEELMARNGPYARMYRIQAENYKEESAGMQEGGGV